MNAYKYNAETKEYIGEVPCQLNPVASEREGREVYLLPADATFKAPVQKEGYACLWSGEMWTFVEDHRGEKYYPADATYQSQPEEMKELGPLPEGATITPPEKTETDLLREELMEKQGWLSAHDYIGTKIATGRATVADYADVIEQMKIYAARVDELNNLLSTRGN